ncbi:esterase [Chimaeribacter coloradensis]|uniref:Esterase n=1 Tax=Chimaeribacter coloradensis TaxID=2060068 RepID=A0A2N5E7X6_9GAMM|nr:alpha/beta hydrolase-fold protein [Chimaeribacter coloradensis]PLR37582.1 esterase [Chimaeribacter coloradensis]
MRALFLLLGLCLSTSALAGEAYTLPDSQVETLASGAGDYQIMTYVPPGKPPAEGWPVIYLLDGNAAFPLAAGMMSADSCARCVMQPGVIVAVGYPGASRRDVDYRPATAQVALESNPAGGTYPPGAPGNAQAFYHFLETRLKPHIAAQWPINPHQQALFGHSYGGLFAVYAALTHPQAFQHIYAASPSVWWNNRYLETLAAQTLTQPAPVWPEKVRLTVGEFEQSLQQSEMALPEKQRAQLAKHRAQRAMVDGVRQLSWTLQRAPGGNAHVSFMLYPGQSHQTVMPPALQDALLDHFGR